MTAKELKQIIEECCNDVYFDFNGKKCGVTSTVENSVPNYQAWCGDAIKYYGDRIDDVMNDKFYDGQSLCDLIISVDLCFA